MKKFLMLTFIFCCSAFVFCKDECKENGCTAPSKMPALDIGFEKIKTEEDVKKEELEKLVASYNKASAKDKKAALQAVKKAVTQEVAGGWALERETIKRQRRKLDVWSENLDAQEKNKDAIIEQRLQEVLAGKTAATPWEALKEKQTKKAEAAKEKVIKKTVK